MPTRGFVAGPAPFDLAEIGALAQLYRDGGLPLDDLAHAAGRDDQLVAVMLEPAMSISFKSPDASPLPLLLAGRVAKRVAGVRAARPRRGP